MAVYIDSYALSDVGKVREVNEDRYLVADLNRSLKVHRTNLGHDDQTLLFSPSQGQLFVVADGMGGHMAGDRASTLAVDALIRYTLNCVRWFFRLGDNPEDDFLDDLKSAVENCQTEIEAETEVVTSREGMGTTVTAGYVIWPRFYVVHVGDSRCCLLRGNKLSQITKDHTVAQQLADEGSLAREDVEGHRLSHMLWNVVGGGSEEISPEVYKAELSIGDTVILCSDGLTKHVSDGEIVTMLGRHASAEDACRALVEVANDAGGTDNITVVVARFRDTSNHETAQSAEASEATVEEADSHADTDPFMQPVDDAT